MSKPRKNSLKKSPDGSRYVALALFVLLVIVIGGYLIAKPRQQAAPPTHPLPPRPQAGVISQEIPRPVQAMLSTNRPQKKDTPAKQATVPAPVAPAPRHSNPSKLKGTLSIIIDDMGSSMQEARSLASIGVPLTFSIIPGLPHFREVADFAVSHGIEIMIHMPMQSKGWPQRRLEANGLLVSMNNEEISSRLNEYIRSVPGASGANNHMGSEFTEHEEKMRPVLTLLKEKNFFFIDSVTTPNSVGHRMAQKIGMKSARRHVFLDNEQNRDYIAGQLRQAVSMAGKNGSAIAICHPHPATISTLAALLPALKQQGITLTPASLLTR